MFLNLAAVIASLGRDAAFRIANAARVPGDYLFNSILPERQVWNYQVDAGNMTVRSTMAGLVGMDSIYPPGGMVETSTFLENTAKIAVEVGLSEAALRQMQQFLMNARINNQPTDEAARDEVLNFLDKVIIQPMMDRAEWLRGQALTFGAINWTFGDRALVVNYGVPSGNFLPLRTIASGNNYAGASSKWWADIQAIRRALRAHGGLRAIIAHPDTVDEARYNTVNEMVVTAETNSSITFRRVIPATGQFTADANDTVTIVMYDLEGEVLNPANTAQTLRVPFMTRGKLVGVGNNRNTGFRVGMGSTDDPNASNDLGYTHVAPTIEGGGRPGRWAQLYTPEAAPWEMRGRSAQNLLPVIEAPERLVIATTEMTP
jgi:hypothetical protein